MKSELVHKLLSPWNVARDRAPRLLSSLLADLIHNERPSKDVWGDPLPQMEISGGIARIPLAGVLMVGVPRWAKELGLGITDAYDIEEEVAAALADPAVSIIALDIDSPGGQSVAGEHIYSVFAAAAKKKPVMAFTRGLMASAAYQSAAPCQAIYCTAPAEVGCIGTYCVYTDDSKMLEAMGIAVEVFRSGKYKGMGIDSLTDEQRAHIQASVDRHGAAFRASVARHRPMVAAADMEGQCFGGADAVSKGFCAAIAPTFTAAADKFKKLVKQATV